MTFQTWSSTHNELLPGEKLILVGLHLSKYDSLGLKRLGFDSFIEAFNVIGYALGSRPASIKNYRDEFDPLFPNRRKGWRKRKTREYCVKVFEEYRRLDLESFTGLVKSFVGDDENALSALESKEKSSERYVNAVSKPEIRAFSGSLGAAKANKGVFVTTSCFTQPAQNFAERHPFKIVVIDGERLAALMIRHNVGVRIDETLYLKKVDEDFFVDE